MRPVSEQFLTVARQSAGGRFEARIVTGHQTGVNPTGTTIPILDGEVTFDGTADVRGSLDLTTSADWPDSPAGLLAPYGNEIFVRAGLEYGDRSVEWVSLGYFRIGTTSQDDPYTGGISITAQDRMAGIIEAKLTAPVQFNIGDTMQDVFEQLITDVYPDAVLDFDFDASAVVFTRSYVAEEDRYAFLRDLATSQAKDFYVDYQGRFAVADRPDPDEPVYTVNVGENGVLVSLSRELSREGVYNGVIATGEGADEVEPVSAVAVDNNPASPTYWYGQNTAGRTFGKVPRSYSSPFITTTEQAQSAAVKILRGSLGLPFSLELGIVPNPALEPFDPVRAVADPGHPDGEIHVLQAVTIPLTNSNPMRATTKNQTSVDIEVT